MSKRTRTRSVKVTLATLVIMGLGLTAMALAPSNDDFDDAISISEGIELWADTRDGTVEAGESLCGMGPTAYWKFTAPAAGDYGPGEAGFLARSKEAPEKVLTDWRQFDRLRKEHVPQSKADRSWLKYDQETFLDPAKRVDEDLPKFR